MKTTVHRTDDTVRIRCGGRFDANEIDGFRQVVDPDLVDVARLEIELDDVVFLDSSALAELVRLRAHVMGLGGGFAVTRMSDPVRIIFDVTDLLAVLAPAVDDGVGAGAATAEG